MVCKRPPGFPGPPKSDEFPARRNHADKIYWHIGGTCWYICSYEKRLNPGDPLDKDIYALTPEELKEVPSMPASLDEALGNLQKDHEFLLAGDVFTQDVIDTWIEYKMANEVSAMRLRPHPHEFNLYFDA